MKKLIFTLATFLLLILMFSSQAWGQTLKNVDVFMDVIEVRHNYDCGNDAGAGDPEPRWKFWGGYNGTNFTQAATFPLNGGTRACGIWNHSDFDLRNISNNPTSYMSFDMESWEEDGCGGDNDYNTCTINSDDAHTGRTRMANIYFRKDAPNTYNQYGWYYGNNGYGARVDILYSCDDAGDGTTDGSGSWIGYVYDGTTPGSGTYYGYITANETFDYDFSADYDGYHPTSCRAFDKSTFSISYQMTQSFVAGCYTFTIGSDDGARLYIDGALQINRWADQGYSTSSADINLSTGSHALVLEYYENGGGNRVSFSYVSCNGVCRTDVQDPGNVNGYTNNTTGSPQATYDYNGRFASGSLIKNVSYTTPNASYIELRSPATTSTSLLDITDDTYEDQDPNGTWNLAVDNPNSGTLDVGNVEIEICACKEASANGSSLNTNTDGTEITLSHSGNILGDVLDTDGYGEELRWYADGSFIGTGNPLTITTASLGVTGSVDFTARFFTNNEACGNLTNPVSVTIYQHCIDVDQDGFGDSGNCIYTTSVIPPSGYANNNTDCDDNDDEEFPEQQWINDGDNDGYHTQDDPFFSVVITQCERPGSTWIPYSPTADFDCDDADNTVYPNAPESVCPSGKDENCDGIDGANPTAITTVNGATGTCSSNARNDWLHIVDNNEDLIAEIHDNGNNLGDVTITLLGTGNASTSHVCTGGLGSYMGRIFRITSTNTWSGNVNVRLYFTAAELSSLQSEAGCGDANGCADDDDVCGINNIVCTKHPTGNGPGGVTGVFHNQAGNGMGYGASYVEFVFTSFSDVYLHGSEHGVPLPVELMVFTASVVDNTHIQLNWVTATEINNQGFEIQRSLDREYFETIGWVDGNGNTTETIAYSYIDKNVVSGVDYYYRLKQVDFNGEYEYSPMRSVKIEKVSSGDFSFRLIPNPAKDFVYIEGDFEGDIAISVADINGKVVYQNTVTQRENIIRYKILTKELANGVYYVTIVQNGKSRVQKLVINK